MGGGFRTLTLTRPRHTSDHLCPTPGGCGGGGCEGATCGALRPASRRGAVCVARTPLMLSSRPQFFTRLGLPKLRFKPAFNPYTEPSMEIFSYSEQLGKWMEVGNSGMFRPEMLRPMGLPEDVNVIAWGLSLVRARGACCVAGGSLTWEAVSGRPTRVARPQGTSVLAVVQAEHAARRGNGNMQHHRSSCGPCCVSLLLARAGTPHHDLVRH